MPTLSHKQDYEHIKPLWETPSCVAVVPYMYTLTQGNVGWDLIGYDVGGNSIDEKELELEEKWEWLYGKLADGEYRIIKDYFINNAWQTHYYVAAEFIIE